MQLEGAIAELRWATWSQLLRSSASWLLVWVLLGFAALALFELGSRTPFGYALLCGVFPLLALEASWVARRRFRARLARSVAFVTPGGSLLAFGELLPDSCCFCGHSPAARALRILESFASFTFVVATLSFAALTCLGALLWSAATRRETAEIRASLISVALSVLCLGALLAFMSELIEGPLVQARVEWSERP